ncbi:ATP-dependent DNA helicase srs2 [Apiospora phragmitis]|uniref:DNA 3'-5' helicase n=1 Tax=Apiospora phragmitis TaxID=2905665 RepID=A0ABR1VEW5_9PEZI
MAAVNNASLFSTLNKAQTQAVSSNAPTVAILAGPGSGKTHTLTSRVVWLVDHVGYQPCDVLVATFTVKAAREMKERIGKALGGGREKKIVLGTFHSIARRYLATYGQRIGLDPKFGIADDSDSRGIITRICKRLDTKIDPPAAKAWISKKKARGTVDDAPTKSKAFMTCFMEYQQHLERANLLDYDDLLVRCVELLRRYPSCVSNIQSVLIDEYQDTNGVQYELMKLFAQERRRITIVGDPDQSIYGWRSAEIRNLFRFLRDFNGTEEISLEENYRSSSSILDVSLRVIQQQRSLRKEPTGRGGLDRLQIKRAKAMSGGMIKEDDVAILLRSAILSRHVESALGKSGIPYKMIGGFKFYERTEIKVVLDYLRIIHQPDNNDALARIINVPKRGIGDATVKSLLEEAERGSTSLWKLLVKHCRGDRNAKTTIRKQTEQKISGELLKLINNLRIKWADAAKGKGFDLVELIEQLLKDLGFEKHLEDTYGDEYESRWSNVQEFVALAAEFMKDPSLTEEDALPDIASVEQVRETDVLAKFLANVSLASDKQTDSENQDKPLVTVSTIHAAKGLEWPMVFIPAVYKGSIPHIRSDDDAEERRLLYVAMTRAQALLYLSCPLYGSHSSNDALQLSPFVEDLSATQFLKRGPSFERPTMQEVGRILRRELPPEDAIYKGMAYMTPIEDNLFPDPTEAKETGRSSTGASSEARQLKRHKTHHISNTGQSNPEVVEGWNAPYSTTMQKSSSFTLPGFTTAGAHHVANPQEPRPKPGPAAGPSRRPVSNRPPAQRTLRGFVITDHDQSKTTSEALGPILQPRRVLGQSQSVGNRRNPIYPTQQGTPLLKKEASGGIESALTDHKLGSAKITSRPTKMTPSEQPQAVPAVKQYACFSSSPTKPEKDEEEEATVVLAEEQTRPASCFHSTTVGAPQALGFRGVKRPAGLSHEGIAPMDRLKKPFKPLTIKRPWRKGAVQPVYDNS